MNKIQKYIILK